jgi:hypothetical protein
MGEDVSTTMIDTYVRNRGGKVFGALLTVEILDDDLAHFEISQNRTGPDPPQGIYITLMVDQAGYKNYPGPTRAGFSAGGNVIETGEMRISMDDDARCARIVDKVRGGVNLTRICGEDLGQDTKRLRIERQDMQIGKYGRLQCALK